MAGSGAVATAIISSATNFPATVSYHQGRRWFGGSTQNPQTLYATKSGSYYNMDSSEPVQADDSITATIAAQTANPIHAMIPVQQLIVFTLGGAWQVTGGSASDVITPSSTVVTPQIWSGASELVRPVVVGNDIIYVQAMGASVRNLAYNLYASAYQGTDIALLSTHLLFGHRLVAMDSAMEPYKIVWFVRDDGVALSLTYLHDQDVYAWSRHDTIGGQFLDVCVVSEPNPWGYYENVPYFLVRRTLNGVSTQTVERMHTRQLGLGNSDVKQSWFVDCGLQYSGTATATVSGLNHLAGQTVAILADGAVFPQQVVGSDGTLTIPQPASIITVGLPIQAQLESLPIDVGEPTIQGKRKRVSRIRVLVENTRGLKAGPVNQQKGPLLVEFKERSIEAYGTPTNLVTGQEFVNTNGTWDVYGTVLIQQDNPLPCSILGIVPEFELGT